MKQILVEKEYEKLLNDKRKIEATLKLFLARKVKGIEEFSTGNQLLELSRLRLRGGPKDLSSKFKFYLYNR